MATDVREAHDRHEIQVWRRRRLLESGFPRTLATQVASDARYDLHALIELTERGCPPDLAVRILAPLDEAAA